MKESIKLNKSKFFTAANMAVMGVLTAAAYALYILPKILPVFNLPFFPPWLDIQISDLPAMLGGFAIGPWAGVIIIVIKCLLKMPLTSTSCVGELADILVGIAFVLPAALIYQKHKNRKSAIVGMSVGSASAIAMSVLTNWLVLIPFYALQFGNMDFDAGMNTIVSAVKVLYGGITVENFYAYYLPLAVLPFNILRCAISAVLTYFTYKPLSRVLHWEKGKAKSAAAENAHMKEFENKRQSDNKAEGDGAETPSDKNKP